MLRRQLNHASIGLRLEPRGPILIKSGLESADPTRPSMELVRTRHPVVGETVYLPGTSLKGAVRSHAEALLRSRDLEVCDPFDKRSHCRQAQGETTAEVFAAQCLACRTFGSLKVTGRCNIQDAYPWPAGVGPRGAGKTVQNANRTEVRWQVGIDRKTGGASGGALFDLEVIVGGAFYTEVHLQNFQLWQLTLLQAVFEDLSEGFTAIGFGKSRGLGQVLATVERLELSMASRETDCFCGVAALCSAEERRAYRLNGRDTAPLARDLPWKLGWSGARLALSGDDSTAVLGVLAEEGGQDLIDGAVGDVRGEEAS